MIRPPTRLHPLDRVRIDITRERGAHALRAARLVRSPRVAHAWYEIARAHYTLAAAALRDASADADAARGA